MVYSLTHKSTFAIFELIKNNFLSFSFAAGEVCYITLIRGRIVEGISNGNGYNEAYKTN